MANGDLYQLTVNIAVRNTHTSFGMYYEEIAPDPAFEEDAGNLAEAWYVTLGSGLKSIIAADCTVTYIYARRIKGLECNPGYFYPADGIGDVAGESLTASNGMRIRLLQDDRPGRFNGAINVPGCPVTAIEGNDLTADFLTAIGVLFSNQLSDPVQDAANGTGVWVPVTLTRGTPPNDPAQFVSSWVTEASPLAAIRSQSRRRSDVRAFPLTA